MRSSKRSSTRGAALVEFSLSLLLIIPSTLYAIYIGEAFLAANKAQEAEVGALFDLTAYRYHAFDVAPGAAPARVRSHYNQAIAQTQIRAQTRLQGLDSFSQTQTRHQWAAGSGLLEKVSCSKLAAGGPLEQTFDTFGMMEASAGVSEYFHKGGLVSCRANVLFQNTWIPQRFGGKFERTALLQGSLNRMRFCGIGASLNGCDVAGQPGGGLALLTDEWNLENGHANRAVPRSKQIPVAASLSESDRNPEYYRLGRAVYLAHKKGLGEEQVREDFWFLLGIPQRDGDFSSTSEFKLGFQVPIGTPRDLTKGPEKGLDVLGGPKIFHLTGWDDDDPGSAITPGKVVFGQRRDGNYLGHPNPAFNNP